MKKILFLVLLTCTFSFSQKKNYLSRIPGGVVLIDTTTVPVVIPVVTPIIVTSPAFPQLQVPSVLCVNGTTTNPLSPANPQFPNYLNHFNWQNNSPIPYNTPILNNTYTPNPFFSNQPEFQNIALQQDFKTENGWEALAYNLGYDNNNVSLLAPPQHSYFLLYNKHRGILRVMLKWSGLPSTFNQSLLTLQFAPGFQTNLLDMTTYEKPLLASHIPNPKYTTSLKFFNGVDNWSYADFKVNYDPCTCNFTENSRLSLKTNLIQNSNISLSGSITGTITSITNGTVNGTDGSKGKFWNDVNGVNKTFTTFHEGAKKFVDNYQAVYNTLNNSGIKIAAIQNLGNFMTTNSFLKAGLKAAPYVSQAVSFISSLFAGGAGASGPQELAPLSVDLSVKLNGTITYNADMHNLTVGLPGSQKSGVLTGVNGGQPLYNKPLGVFSLIDEPTMYYTESSYLQEEQSYRYGRYSGNTWINNFGIPYQLKETIGSNLRHKFLFKNRSYKMDGSLLRYIINPASNLVLQDSQIVLMAEYEKPSIRLSSNIPANYPGVIGNSLVTMNPNVDVNTDNGLTLTGTTDVGNNIDRSSNLFQNSFAPIGNNNFKNNYSFNYLYDIERTQNVTDLFDFGVQSIDLNRNYYQNGQWTLSQYVKPKPEYLEARVKTFKLKLILNLKRTDNPNAQNVLYVVSYPVKILPAPAGYNIIGSNYASDALDYANNINGNSNILTPFTGNLQSLCDSSSYKNSRMQVSNYKISSKEAKDEITNSESNNIDFSPNPVTDVLNLKRNNCKLINLISIDGRELRRFENNNSINAEYIDIDFNDFSKGIYIINYENAEGEAKFAKIIKQ